MREVICLSVLTGWQSAYKDTEETFGPVFGSVNQLWDWQKDNLFG
jgi:hypothetical protein